MPRARKPCMFSRERYPRSVCILHGRRRGRPRQPCTGTMRSTIMRSVTTSGTFDAVSMGGASGRPCRSTITWCLEPSLPRSVGFFPVWAPPFLQERAQSQPTHATSRSHLLVGGVRAGFDGRAVERRCSANHAGASSRSCHCTRVGAADTPRVSRYEGQMRFLPTRLDPAFVDALDAAGALAQGDVGR